MVGDCTGIGSTGNIYCMNAFDPKYMTLKEKALQIAITQISKQENPRGSNWGEPVKTYLKSVGINFPASWCMAFVYWCFQEAAKEIGLPNTAIKSGGVLDVYNKAKKKVYVVTDPQPGDVFIQDHGHGLGHTGIVETVDVDSVHTIEGNTNDTGSREGFEVCRKSRLKSKIVAYVRYV